MKAKRKAWEGVFGIFGVVIGFVGGVFGWRGEGHI
jgi:hypothetical protein